MIKSISLFQMIGGDKKPEKQIGNVQFFAHFDSRIASR